MLAKILNLLAVKILQCTGVCWERTKLKLGKMQSKVGRKNKMAWRQELESQQKKRIFWSSEPGAALGWVQD